jgi:hypothetical protein
MRLQGRGEVTGHRSPIGHSAARPAHAAFSDFSSDLRPAVGSSSAVCVASEELPSVADPVSPFPHFPLRVSSLPARSTRQSALKRREIRPRPGRSRRLPIPRRARDCGSRRVRVHRRRGCRRRRSPPERIKARTHPTSPQRDVLAPRSRSWVRSEHRDRASSYRECAIGPRSRR